MNYRRDIRELPLFLGTKVHKKERQNYENAEKNKDRAENKAEKIKDKADAVWSSCGLRQQKGNDFQ